MTMMKVVKREREEEVADWNATSPSCGGGGVSGGGFSVTVGSSYSSGSYDNNNVTPRSTLSQGRANGPLRRSSKAGWTQEEDELLTVVVRKFNGKNWKKIAEHFSERTDIQCLHRWQKVVNPELVKGAWTKEEDDCIIELVQKHGCKKWSLIAKYLPGRIGKQCRERWCNHLDPAIRKDAWTEAEESLLAYYHKIYGNKWAEIARFLPGSRKIHGLHCNWDHCRTDNAIKNHWNCSLKKKLDLQAFYNSTPASVKTTPKASCALVDYSGLRTVPLVYAGRGMPPKYGSEKFSTELALGNTPKEAQLTKFKAGDIAQIETIRTAGHCLNRSRRNLFDEKISAFAGLDTPLSMPTKTEDEAATLTSWMPLESAKRHRDCSLAEDLGFRNLDKSFLSLSMSGFEGSIHGKKRSKVHGMSSDFEDTCHHQVHKKSSDSPMDLETGKENIFGYVQNRDGQLDSPIYLATPISFVRSASANTSSPESILKNSAMSFTTPSIIRRRFSGTLCDSNGKGMSIPIMGISDMLPGHRPVERCLEPSFDLEAKLTVAKDDSSIASPDDNVGLKSVPISCQ